MSLPVPSLLGVAAEPARLEDLLRDNHAFIWRCVRRFGVAEGSVDDVVQEAFIVTAKRLREVEPGKERAFLTSTAYLLSSNWRRSHRRRPHLCELDEAGETPNDHPSAEDLLDQRRARQLLDQALDILPEKLRAPFVLFAIEGMTRVEVAELLGLAPGTVASRVQKARALFESAVLRLTPRATHERGER
jgi:RNA polymerase sigma-70 factor (ECF subfamily)